MPSIYIIVAGFTVIALIFYLTQIFRETVLEEFHIGRIYTPRIKLDDEGLKVTILGSVAYFSYNPKRYLLYIEQQPKSKLDAQSKFTSKKVDFEHVLDVYIDGDDGLECDMKVMVSYRVILNKGWITNVSGRSKPQETRPCRLDPPKILFHKETKTTVYIKVVKAVINEYTPILQYSVNSRCGSQEPIERTYDANSLATNVQDNRNKEDWLRKRYETYLAGPVFAIPCSEHDGLLVIHVTLLGVDDIRSSMSTYKLRRMVYREVPPPTNVEFRENRLQWAPCRINEAQKYQVYIRFYTDSYDYEVVFDVHGHEVYLKLRIPGTYVMSVKAVTFGYQNKQSDDLVLKYDTCLPDEEQYYQIYDISTDAFTLTYSPNPSRYCTLAVESMRISVDTSVGETFREKFFFVDRESPSRVRYPVISEKSLGKARVQIVLKNNHSRYMSLSTEVKFLKKSACTHRNEMLWWTTIVATQYREGYAAKKFVKALHSCTKKETEDLSLTCLKDYLSNAKNYPYAFKPFKEECLTCFDKLMSCRKLNCSEECISLSVKHLKQCFVCETKNCRPDFFVCSGLDQETAHPMG